MAHSLFFGHMPMNFRFISSIFDVSAHDWNQLWSHSYPFTQHAFFAALEESRSTSIESGWQAQHLLVDDNGTLQAIIPLFIKTHSYGEYVFDWALAQAYQEHGMDYYPKIINAIPYTPATGPRFGFKNGLSDAQQQTIVKESLHHIQTKLKAIRGSGFHSLFPDKHAVKALGQLLPHNLHKREACQFHWFNQNYANFDDFLNRFASRKRKMVRKERQKVQAQNLDISLRSAKDVDESEWAIFYQLYHRTYIKRSGRPGYLDIQFFLSLAKSMPEKLLLATVKRENNIIAAAVYFRDDDTLYGRYWGAKEDIDGLHFETCYYQGIEYAIQHKLSRFDPGAQGEHKIQRGFTPVKTCSYHTLAHPGFNRALKEFAASEKQHNDRYIIEAQSYLPFNAHHDPMDSDTLYTQDVNAPNV